LQPEPLPNFTVEMVDTLAPKIVISTENPPTKPRSVVPVPPAIIRHHAEWTQASLHLAATTIDRSNCFDEVLHCLRLLQDAITQYNAANTDMVATVQAYRTAEITYGKQLPNVPRLMKEVLETMLAPKRASRA
jgi:hypothetical protein